MSRFPFSPALVLAPMEGVTSAPVRGVLANYAPIGLVCTEFVRIAGEKISRPYLLRQVSPNKRQESGGDCPRLFDIVMLRQNQFGLFGVEP